jgi:hypothetical protein
MLYFICNDQRAIAESPDAVARLLKRGYDRVDWPTFKAYWAADDAECAERLMLQFADEAGRVAAQAALEAKPAKKSKT